MARHEFNVPGRTQQVLQNEREFDRCRNAGLLLSRYLPTDVIENSRKQGDWLKQILQDRFDVTKASQKADDWQALIGQSHQRWQATTADAPVRFEATARERFITGLGSGTVLETGITLHRVTGLPTIDGTAVKGLTRNYALYQIALGLGIRPTAPEELLRQKDNKVWTPLRVLDELLAAPDIAASGSTRAAIAQEQATHVGQIDLHELAQNPAAEAFRLLFGSNHRAGLGVFHHAVLVGLGDSRRLFEVDIMNPHYNKYYMANGNSRPVPSDDMSPVPVKFLTVAKGVVFAFAVGMTSQARQVFDRTAAPAGLTQDSLAGLARDWLTGGLSEYGIGAKTSAGYGRFRATKRAE